MGESLLSELQLITSMYDSTDIRFDDSETALKIESSVPLTGSVSFALKLNDYLTLQFRIPNGYPMSEKFSAHCQINSFNNNNPSLKMNTLDPDLESRLNHGLKRFLTGDDNVCDILTVITWCSEQWETLKSSLDVKECKDACDKTSQICRIWIHSHHIYNEKKRKFLIETAERLDLSGFSLPGKPGFVCVEGEPKNCDEFWSQVRQLTWQKISLIERQLLEESEKAFKSPFEELLIDKSAFMKYLEEKSISSVIKDYLGF